MNRFIHSNKYPLLILAGFWILFSVFFIKPWQLFFLNDDFMHIPDVRLVLRSGFMRPVPNVFLWFDKILYGSKPLGFFITSIVLHGLAVFSVYYLVECIQNKLKLLQHIKDLAFWVALFFLVYPFHAESIMWTIARVSIMATAFTLFSLASFIKADKLNGFFWVSWFWLILALFSYESMWNILPLYFLVAWYKSKERIIAVSTAWLQSGIMIVTFIGYFIIRFALLKSLVGDGYDHMEDNMKNISLVAGNLIKLTARIYTPAIDNPRLFVFLFVFLTLIFIYFLYRQLKANRKTGIFLIILWGAMITGVLTAAPLGIDTHFHESDRYTYYASFYFCFFLAITCQSFFSPKWRTLYSVGFCIIFSAGFYVLQSHYAFSSSATRGTIDLLNKQPAGKKIIFADVPERYKGALIFRTSLPDAIEWLAPACNPDTVIIYSQVPAFRKSGNFKTGIISLQDLSNMKGEQYKKELQIFLNQTGATDTLLFWYGNGGLWQVIP